MSMASNTDDSNLQQMLFDPEQRNEGFRKLMKQYGQTLYWHIRRTVVGHDDAEDVLQETCIKILNRIDSFRGDGSLVMWLLRIIRYCVSGRCLIRMWCHKWNCIWIQVVRIKSVCTWLP